MDTIDSVLLVDEPRRIGFRAQPHWIRIMIPSNSIGVYMLLREGKPFYVGRSDHCVTTRLCSHELLTNATHIVWEPCGTVEHSFRLEAAWFHILSNEGIIRNQIHPARPAGYQCRCPFCGTKDEEALLYVLPHLRKQAAAGLRALTKMAAPAKTTT